jgi:hypothetical protein
MTTHIQPISEVTQRGTTALIREIGVVDTIRFLNQFRAGSGNYTVEREQLFKGMSVEDIVNDIKAQRKPTA